MYNKSFLVSFFAMIVAFAFVVFGVLHTSNAASRDADNSHGRTGIAEKHAPVCPGPAGADAARCHAHVVVDEQGLPKSSTLPSGYGPAQFLGAYGLPGTGSSNQVIAVVDAYDDPNILSDLNKYSITFSIPQLPACAGSITDSAVPCFQKVNQRGGTVYPSVNAGWALEISLDVEVAHAVCQKCKILLVEADSNSYSNLMAAVDQALAKGATVISNSYGSGEFSGETSYDGHFNHQGIVITFSAGDSGYGAEYPAASRYVTAVGGTTLNVNGNNTYGSESAWSGTGSGCSAYELKPSWQSDSLCANRTVADASADADPNTGAAVYDSVRYQGRSGWFKVGGTSLSSPLVAATYALAGGVASGVWGNSLPYSASSASLHDIISGSNGACGGSYLCTAMAGYDGPTGLGTPSGTGGF